MEKAKLGHKFLIFTPHFCLVSKFCPCIPSPPGHVRHRSCALRHESFLRGPELYDPLELSASLFSEVPQPIIYLVINLHPQVGAPEWQRQLYKMEREKRVGLCLFLPSRWVLMAGTFKWTQVEESHTLTLFLDFTHSPWVRAGRVCRMKWLKVSFEGSQVSLLRWQAICPPWSLLLYSFAHLLVHLSSIYSFASIHMCVYPPLYPCIHYSSSILASISL